MDERKARVDPYERIAELYDLEHDAFDDDAAEESEMLRVRIPVGTARAFTLRTREVVEAGRPLCTLCGYPMDPDGHICTIPDY